MSRATLVSFAAILKIGAVNEFLTASQIVFRKWSYRLHHDLVLVNHHSHVNSTPVSLRVEAVCMQLDQPYGMRIIQETF